MASEQWWRELFSIIDTRQTQAFVGYLSEDAMFRYGSNPEVDGRAAKVELEPQVLAGRPAAHAGLVLALVERAVLALGQERVLLLVRPEPEPGDVIPVAVAVREVGVRVAGVFAVGGRVEVAADQPDLLAPLETSDPLKRVLAAVRDRVPTLVDDRPPAPDLDRIAQMIRAGSLEYASGSLVN